ncbi:MAG: hypothetical protein GAK36_00277 [Pseudomonas sp.]|nr:MAG: hypothetical protein GAK36_00277 [Pseudomonas sp.]
MPTENRSSNTEMVSDSELTECQFHNNCGGWCETRRELEHNLCEHCLESHDEEMCEPAPDPQPQSEPATPYGWHVEWADSGEHYLFTKVEKRIEALRLDSDVKVIQLYTHPAPADPGEVERLRTQLADAHWLLRDFIRMAREPESGTRNDCLRIDAVRAEQLLAGADPEGVTECSELNSAINHQRAFKLSSDTIAAAKWGWSSGRAALERKP